MRFVVENILARTTSNLILKSLESGYPNQYETLKSFQFLPRFSKIQEVGVGSAGGTEFIVYGTGFGVNSEANLWYN